MHVYSRSALIYFTAYCLFYGGYVVLSAFFPEIIGRELFAGLNVAVVYGLSLIIVAFILALLYLRSGSKS